ncbi:MAG TPA: hypothetical protein VHZ55_29960 [Bryobacteraceae bacterium]|nr:hypothetical protein [Bryobacteraceae bacterium]
MRFSEAEQRVRDTQKQVNEMKLQRNQLKFEAEHRAKGGPRTAEGKRIASMNAAKTASPLRKGIRRTAPAAERPQNLRNRYRQNRHRQGADPGSTGRRRALK